MKKLTNKKKYTNFFEPVGPLSWAVGNIRENVLSSFRTYLWKANRVYDNIQRKQTLLQTVYQEAEQRAKAKENKVELKKLLSQNKIGKNCFWSFYKEKCPNFCCSNFSNVRIFWFFCCCL